MGVEGDIYLYNSVTMVQRNGDGFAIHKIRKNRLIICYVGVYSIAIFYLESFHNNNHPVVSC